MTRTNTDVLPDPIEVTLSESDRRSIADCPPGKKAEHIDSRVVAWSQYVGKVLLRDHHWYETRTGWRS